MRAPLFAVALWRRGSVVGAWRGFTLLEMCIVLFIIALLAGVALPAMSSAFTEQALRADAHQFALMVRTGMVESGEQNRPYVLALAGQKVSLQPLADEAATTPAPAPPPPAAKPDRVVPDPVPPLENVTLDLTLGRPCELPDPEKAKGWKAAEEARWTFQPEGLCPVPRVRISRGAAWLEMSFNALTGNVENEAMEIP